MKIAFQHASYKPVGRVVVRSRALRRPGVLPSVFGQHLVHEVSEEFLIGCGQAEGLFFFRILEDGQLFPGALSFGEQEVFRECQQGASHRGMSLFEMHLMGKGKEQMTGLYVMTDKVYPVTVTPFLDQEEEVIVLSMGQVKVGTMAYGSAIDLFDLKKVVPVLAGLTECIMRNALLLAEVVQVK